MRETLPELAERPLICKHVCWCADSADSDYIIDLVPGAQGLVVASGDYGHDFKILPTVDRFIRDVIEKGSQDVGDEGGRKGMMPAGM